MDIPEFLNALPNETLQIISLIFFIVGFLAYFTKRNSGEIMESGCIDGLERLHSVSTQAHIHCC